MVITAEERRSVLRLFNTSEAARRIGLTVQQMHRQIRSGIRPSPTIRLGKRLYFAADDLTEQCSNQ